MAAVKGLDVIIDTSLSFQAHAYNVFRIVFFYFRNIAKIENTI